MNTENPYHPQRADPVKGSKKYSVKVLTNFPKILSRVCGTTLSPTWGFN